MSRTARTARAGRAGRGTRGAVPAPRAAESRVLAGRYRLEGRTQGTGVAALDQRSGAEVQLDAVPLPELVVPYDQVALGKQADSTAGRALTQATYVAGIVPDHPRLSQVFQVFDENGYLWVVGESLPGVPLRTLLDRGPLSPYRAAEMGHDLVMALRAVHAVGLVHGNLTADTVTVCADGTALAGGLVVGAAQEALCGGPGAELPAAGVPEASWSPARIRARDARAVIVGAVAERWAPEQAGPPPMDSQAAARIAAGSGAPATGVGPEADAWALGVLLYRSVTGEAPFPERDTEELFAAARSGEIRSAVAPKRPAIAARGAAREASRPSPLPECGPLGPLVHALLRPDPAERLGLPEAAELIRRLLVRAPEPIDQDELLTVAALLPARRRRGEVLEHPDFPHDSHHRHAAPHRHPALLGVTLISGIILFVLIALVVTVLVGR